MLEKESIISRLDTYLKFKKIRFSSFEKKIGVSNGYMNSLLGKGSSLGSDKLESILKNYPDLNIKWLLTSEGEMIEKGIRNLSIQHNGDGDGSISNNTILLGDSIGDYIKEVKHLKELLVEKEKVIAEKERTIQEKERLIQVLLKDKS